MRSLLVRRCSRAVALTPSIINGRFNRPSERRGISWRAVPPGTKSGSSMPRPRAKPSRSSWSASSCVKVLYQLSFGKPCSSSSVLQCHAPVVPFCVLSNILTSGLLESRSDILRLVSRGAYTTPTNKNDQRHFWFMRLAMAVPFAAIAFTKIPVATTIGS